MAQRQARDRRANPLWAQPTAEGHEALHSGFRWAVPERFNIAEVCARRWADDPLTRDHTAVWACGPEQPDRAHTFAELQAQANRLSNVLVALGVGRDQAEDRMQRFRRHDEGLLATQHLIYDDESALLESAKRARSELEQLFEADADRADAADGRSPAAD